LTSQGRLAADAGALALGGRTRTFLYHVPPGRSGPFPVVLNFHGGGSNARQQQGYSGMDATADRHGFVVAYPDGTGLVPGQRHLLTFNAGGCCPPATINGVDDVGFAESIVGWLAAIVPVDWRRVYATGMSNGGMMAHRLAAESALFAAVAPVAGQLNVTYFAPSRPVPVMEFHSVDDSRARYEGGQGARLPRTRLRPLFPGVEAGIERWAAHNGCLRQPSAGPTVTGVPGTINEGQTATSYTYGPGRAGSEVVLVKLTGAGHVWPGSTVALPRLLGRPTTIVDANEVMWRFFAAHPLP
jgi:polyhydroxybutyrate depolymerase